jgi:hypothetical protein
LVVADKRPARNYRGRGRDVQILVEAIRRHETVSLEYRKLAASKAGLDPLSWTPNERRILWPKPCRSPGARRSPHRQGDAAAR